MPQAPDIPKIIKQLSGELGRQGHRQAALISGDSQWTTTTFEKILIASGPANITLVTSRGSALDNHLNTILAPKFRELGLNIAVARPDKPTTLLGYESDHVILDARSGFYPDAISAVAGTIKPSGFLFVLAPAISDWPTSQDDFAEKRTSFGYSETAASPNTINRFIKSVKEHNGLILEQVRNSSEQSDNDANTNSPTALKDTHQGWSNPMGLTGEATSPVNSTLTDEQKHIFSLITSSRSPCINIIRADRGRGKSHLLGLIAKHYLEMHKDNGIKCILTGPNKASVTAAYKSFDLADEQQAQHGELKTRNPNRKIKTQLDFIAPENLIEQASPQDIILVDEAASLPIPLLKNWSNHFSNLTLATTTHGYEGTGKGFQIRFLNYLAKQNLPTKQYELTESIRYADDDPLEQTIFKAFCLNSEPKGLTLTSNEIKNEQLIFKEISQKQLTKDEGLLEETCSLLVQAHYQTRPSDLRDILDAPSIRIFACFNSVNILLGACLTFDEGNLGNQHSSLITAIENGKRRPKGHLVPQVLTLHMAQENALTFKSARIVRIATLPNLQRNNIGSELISFTTKTLKKDGYDFISSSYADTQDVRNFWLKNEFNLVRIGNKHDQSSGTRSGLVLNALSDKGNDLQKSCITFFNEQSLTHQNACTLTPKNNLLIKRFIEHTGSYEAVKNILNKCESWSMFFTDNSGQKKSFPKKAGKDFRELVSQWFNGDQHEG